MKTTKKELLQLFKDKDISPSEIRHELISVKKAVNLLSKETGIDAIDLARLVFFNENIGGTHSYGFHTRHGRFLIETIQDYYYCFERGEEPQLVY